MPSAQHKRKEAETEAEPNRLNDRIISLTEQCEAFGKDRTTIYRRRRSDPRYPKPVNASLRCAEVWESDFVRYLALIQREPLPPNE